MSSKRNKIMSILTDTLLILTIVAFLSILISGIQECSSSKVRYRKELIGSRVLSGKDTVCIVGYNSLDGKFVLDNMTYRDYEWVIDNLIE